MDKEVPPLAIYRRHHHPLSRQLFSTLPTTEKATTQPFGFLPSSSTLYHKSFHRVNQCLISLQQEQQRATSSFPASTVSRLLLPVFYVANANAPYVDLRRRLDFHFSHSTRSKSKDGS